MSVWDEVVKDNEQEEIYPTVPAGEYEFEVVDSKGKEYQPKPGGKLKHCAEIDLRLQIKTADGTKVNVFDRLYSDPSTQWKMTAFAKSIGIYEENMTPRAFLNVVGEKGKAFIKLKPATNEYPARNEVGKYLPAEQQELPF